MADDEKADSPDGGHRRGFLKSAAGATAAVAAVGVSPASVEAQRRPGRLPLNTPITQLGFSPPEIAMLTPTARKLTKGDLMQLQEWSAKGDLKDAPVHLTIQDLSSLQSAYQAMDSREHQPGVEAVQGSISCCCCTPCCSCCAVADLA